jgi:metal-responsive CopG/Arc/MetJ family transcriptional regulator
MKIAISLPKEDFLLLEKLKTKLKKSRSKLIQDAIGYWLKSQKQKTLIEKYENGYRKKPEDISHISAVEKIQYDVLSRENW